MGITVKEKHMKIMNLRFCCCLVRSFCIYNMRPHTDWREHQFHDIILIVLYQLKSI